MSENKLFKIAFFTSKHYTDKLHGIAGELQMPMSRIISWLIDNAFENNISPEYDLTLPRDESLEHAYAEEGGIFMDYMKKLTIGMALDQIMLLRHDIGIPDRKILLTVFAECLDSDLIVPFKPRKKAGRPPFPEGYMYYRCKGNEGNDTNTKRKSRRSDYKQYLRLKQKYGREA